LAENDRTNPFAGGDGRRYKLRFLARFCLRVQSR